MTVCQGVQNVSQHGTDLKEGTFVLVKYIMENGVTKIYLGQIGLTQSSSSGRTKRATVKFLRNYRDTVDEFVWPGIDDIQEVMYNQIVGQVAEPLIQRRGELKFNVDFREWKML